MNMGQGVRTGLGHGGITFVLQTQVSGLLMQYTLYIELLARYLSS